MSELPDWQGCLNQDHEPQVLWVQDTSTVLLVNPQLQKSLKLSGNEAVIWGWLQAGFSTARCARLLAAAKSISTRAAEKEIIALVDSWHSVGWVEKGLVSDE